VRSPCLMTPGAAKKNKTKPDPMLLSAPRPGAQCDRPLLRSRPVQGTRWNCLDRTATVEEHERLSRLRLLQASAPPLALAPFSRSALGQYAFPSRPIRLVVGFTAGTCPPTTARTFLLPAPRRCSARIVVENKPAPSPRLRRTRRARRPTNGYTRSCRRCVDRHPPWPMKPTSFDLQGFRADLLAGRSAPRAGGQIPDRACSASPT